MQGIFDVQTHEDLPQDAVFAVSSTPVEEVQHTSASQLGIYEDNQVSPGLPEQIETRALSPE